MQLKLLLCVVASVQACQCIAFEKLTQPDEIAEVMTGSNLTVRSRLPARSDIECAVRCSVAGLACAASALASDKDDDDDKTSKMCLLLGQPTEAAAAGGAGTGAEVASAGSLLLKEQVDVLPDVSPANPSSDWPYSGYTVIQQRTTGKLSFIRNWSDYVNGFGNLNLSQPAATRGEFWLGLQAIHNLTAAGRLLRVELTLWTGQFYAFEYANFTVGGADTKYQMDYGTLLAATSNATGGGDALADCKAKQFSTADSDNVPGPKTCSAPGSSSGWWFGADCSGCNLNGGYNTTETAAMQSRFFWTGPASSGGIRTSRLMLR